MSATIVYYVQGPVHPRNLRLIASEMHNWEFRVVHDASVSHSTSKALTDVPFQRVVLRQGQVPPELWHGNVQAVIFSAIQPRQGPLNLMKSALQRRIPMVAIEESNQIGLNLGISSNNNYLAPTDHVLVASPFEREHLIGIGVPERRVRCTGWPFHAGPTGKSSPEQKRKMKERLGLDPERPVATLALIAFGDVGEDRKKRQHQIRLAAQGTPSQYQLVIKGHPVEGLGVLMPFVRECAPNATVIESSVPISDVLVATDVLLNRGVSQVTIEALLQEIPVVILSVGHWTPFHEHAPSMVVRDTQELSKVLTWLMAETAPMHVYEGFFKEHVPYSPAEARRLTCQALTEIATERLLDPEPEEQWLDLSLFQAWKLNPSLALDSLGSWSDRKYDGTTQALHDLIRCRADRRQLHELRRWTEGSFREDILRSLWVVQLYRTGSKVTEEDLTWMHAFPPEKNTPFYYEHVWRWIDVLVRSDCHNIAEELALRMHDNYSYNSVMNSLPDWLRRYKTNRFGRIQYGMWQRWVSIRPRLSQFRARMKELRL